MHGSGFHNKNVSFIWGIAGDVLGDLFNVEISGCDFADVRVAALRCGIGAHEKAMLETKGDAPRGGISANQ